MIKKLLAVSVLFLLILCPLSAGAIQSLGVAPGAPGSGGTYFGPQPPMDGDDSYMWVFADTFIGGEGGFAMPASGEELSIWYGADNGIMDDDDSNVYLLTTSESGGSFTFKFYDNDNGNLVTLVFTSQPYDVASYKPPIYGVDLGSIDGNWTELTQGEFGTGGKEFYVLTGIIEYSGFEIGDWMYAATTNSPVVAQFSSQTTASTVVPEPATMMLFGTGLIGLAALGRKKFRKN